MARFQGIVTIDRARCKGCSLCVSACPLKLLALENDINAKGYHPAAMKGGDKCSACALCAQMCPEVCITVEKEER